MKQPIDIIPYMAIRFFDLPEHDKEIKHQAELLAQKIDNLYRERIELLQERMSKLLKTNVEIIKENEALNKPLDITMKRECPECRGSSNSCSHCIRGKQIRQVMRNDIEPKIQSFSSPQYEKGDKLWDLIPELLDEGWSVREGRE